MPRSCDLSSVSVVTSRQNNVRRKERQLGGQRKKQWHWVVQKVSLEILGLWDCVSFATDIVLSATLYKELTFNAYIVYQCQEPIIFMQLK